VFADASGKLTFDDVRAPSFRSQLAATAKAPDFGFDASTAWLRFEAHNGAGTPRNWLLVLDYPHLDDVILYVEHADGRREQHVTGDLLPFLHRDVAVPAFVFKLENAPGETLVAYLRVKSTGSLRMPLSAWEPDAFYQHQLVHNLILWGFYGALIMMALFNFAVWALIRQTEFLIQALFVLSIWAVTFTFGGEMFQYVVPGSPIAANKSLNVFFALAACTATFAFAQVTSQLPGYQGYTKLFRVAGWFAAALTVFTLFAPKQLGLVLSTGCAVSYVIGGVVVRLVIHRTPHPQLQLYLVSWTWLLAGVPVTVLSYTGTLPPHPLLHWAAHIGCAMQALFTSLALAARVKRMRDDLAALNGELMARNATLSEALERTRQANDEAQRATRARDDFLATMTHELRTPLNAIINLPEGLLEYFREERAAKCTHCREAFLLDPGERLDPSTACIACGRAGTLQAATRTSFDGDLALVARFLGKIERAGRHLLQLVNAVLDFSKIEVGALELSVGPLDLGVLLREVVEEMRELADAKGLTLVLDLERDAAPCNADAVRLTQVLINLIANAIKFSERDGVITVRYRRGADADVVSVEDQGIGIAQADHERVFQRFEQVHKGDVRRYGGTGLGLAIARALVELHGGSLSLESALGAGSTFTFRIPRTELALARSA